MNACKKRVEFAPPPLLLEEPYRRQIFLSYRSANRAWVVNRYDNVRDRGHEVCLDQYPLTPDDLLISRLEEDLGKSHAGVMV